MIQAMHLLDHITPVDDGGDLDGSQDSTPYGDAPDDHWNLLFWHNPFADVMLNYNGYDATTSPATPGTVPEFYWFMFARWSPYNGGNDWDIDAMEIHLTNGLDTDQDADGLPDWWDQDEANDGIMDTDDPKMGGSFNLTQCGWTAGKPRFRSHLRIPIRCGLPHATQWCECTIRLPILHAPRRLCRSRRY